MKKFLFNSVFCLFFASKVYPQPCYDWSLKTVTNTNTASTYVNLINGNDLIEYSSHNHSFSLPPTNIINIRRVINGNVSSPFNIYNSTSSPANYGIVSVDLDFNNKYYVCGNGPYSYNGNSYTGQHIKLYSASGSVLGYFPIGGVLKQIDFDNILYAVSSNYIVRYTDAGAVLDSVEFNNTLHSIDENKNYTLTNGDTIRRYLYPDSLIQTLIIPGLKSSFSYDFGQIRHHLAIDPVNPDSISVIDSSGTLLYKVFEENVYQYYVINGLGELYCKNNTTIKKFDASGQVWSTSLNFYMDGGSSSLSLLRISNNGDIYFSGTGSYTTAGVTGPNTELAYFIKPGLYQVIDGSFSGYEIFGFIGKIKADGSACNDGISTPTLNLCSGVSGSFTGSSSDLFDSQSFRLELSDSAGSFTNPMIIGSSNYPVVNYTVPNNLPAGNYMIRGVLTNPLEYATPKPVTISNVDFSGTRELTNMIHDSVMNRTFSCLPSSFTVHANAQGMQYRLLAKSLYNNFQSPITSYSSDSIFNFISASNINKELSVQLKNSATGCESKWPLINYVSADTMSVSMSASFFPGDTIVNCKNSPPVKLSYYPQPAINEIVNGGYISGNGIYLNSLTKIFYFHPDSVTPGFHTIYFDISTSGMQCGNLRDSLTFFVDTCMNTIVTGIVAPSGGLCANQLANIPFSSIGTYDSTNIFKVIFNNVVIGEGITSPITIVVPNDAAPQARFRVISTSPPDTGTYNYDGEFEIIGFNKPEILTPSYMGNCFRQGDPLYAPSSSGYIKKWFVNDSLLAETTSNGPIDSHIPGIYHVEINNGVCSGNSDSVFVLDSADFNFSLELEYDTGFICHGDTMRAIAHTWAGSTFKWYFDMNLLSNETDSILVVTQKPRSGVYSCEVNSPLGYKIRKHVALPSTFPRFNLTLDELTSDTVVKCYSSLPANLSITGSNNATFQWYKNGLLSPGDTLRTISVTSEGYFVLETTENGCSSTSPVIHVKNVAPAVMTLAPNYSTFACDGDSVQIFVTGNVATNYKWYWNSLQIEDAQTDNYYAKESGIYSVQAIDSNGCRSVVSPNYTRFFREPCPDPIFIGSVPSLVCPNDSIMLQVESSFEDKFVWYVNGVADTTSNTNSLVVTQPGSYFVEVESRYGCKGVSDTLTFTQGTTPVATTIALGNTTFCQGDSVSLRALYVPFSDYQWYRNQILIPGATSQIYKAKSDGLYTVMITNADGCSNISNPISVEVPCMPVGEDVEKLVNDEDASNLISIFPNPVDQILTISIGANQSDKLRIELFDFSGRLSKIVEMEVSRGKSSFEFRMNDLVSGMYSFRISGVHFNEYFKIFKE